MPLSSAERNKRYRERHPGRNAASCRKYANSDKGKQRLRSLTLSGELARRERERYHRIQEEAGCHLKPRDFYPGYCVLKALEIAEVVEI